jgi:hypothetical protein
MIDVHNFSMADLPQKRTVEPPPNTSNTKYIGTKMVKLSSIKIDSEDLAQNTVRSKGRLEEHLYNLETSFTTGVRPELPLPSLYQLKTPYFDENGNWIENAVADGLHRVTVLDRMCVDQYPMDIWQQSDDATKKEIDDTWYKFGANDHPPSVRPSTNDVICTFGKLIRLQAPQFHDPITGVFDVELLKKELKKYSVRASGKLLTQIQEKAGLPIAIKQWTGKQAAEWVESKYPNMTLEVDSHIFNEGNGTWDRTMFRTLDQAFETGKPQNVILNPTKGNPKPVKDRKAFKQKILAKGRMLMGLFGGTKDIEEILHIYYALPQILEGDDREDFDKFIDLNSSPYV